MKNFIARTITGVLFVACVVASFFHPLAMTVLFALVTFLSVWEFSGLVNQREGVTINRFITATAACYFYLAMAGFCGGITPPTVFIPYLITIVYLLVAELYAKQTDPVNNWAYTMMSQLYIALPFSLLNVLAFHSSFEGVAFTSILPLSVFIFLWVNDTGAYCCGSLLGRHKLFPRISPGKSWEGSVGGGVFVLVAAALIWHFISQDGNSGLQLSLLQWLGLGLTVVVFGTWGDLVESLFKRTLGIKDSGNILPGHGGVLDRFDSSLLAIPAAVVYLFTLTLF